MHRKTFAATLLAMALAVGLSPNGTFAAEMLDYSLPDAIRTVRGIGPAQTALAAEQAALDLFTDLPAIGVPIVMAQGRLDRIAPADTAERYFTALHAPRKELVWFEHSAHTPQLDEPDAFRSLLLRVLGQEQEDQGRVA